MNNSSTNPSAPAVVFLHGVGGSARIWAPQLASFATAGFRPVALDMPGYGGREPVDRMDFDMLAADVEAEVTRLALDRPIIVGAVYNPAKPSPVDRTTAITHRVRTQTGITVDMVEKT